MDIKSLRYKKAIIKELSFGNILSAHEISLRIEKSLPITHKLLGELVEADVLEESGLAVSTGGRRPLMYALKKDKLYVITVAMDQYFTKIGIIDIQDLEIKQEEKYELPLPENAAALGKLTAIIQKYLTHNFIEKEKILGIGIGMPGFVDVQKGINYSFLPTEAGRNITQTIEDAVELPVFIDNDSSLIALTELALGPQKYLKNAMVINFGWGVGLGMILNGSLFRGNNGFAGEFSHIPVFNNNKLCSCGKSGCLETEASLFALLQKTKAALAGGRVSAISDLSGNLEQNTQAIMDAAIAGDQLAVELISDIAYDIGRGVAILIHILNPEHVIISGRGARAGSLLLAPVYQAINKYCIPRLASYTQISVSSFSANAEMLGAAALVLENFDKKHLQKLMVDPIN